jgi:hypothetical protein
MNPLKRSDQGSQAEEFDVLNREWDHTRNDGTTAMLSATL